MQLYPTPSVYTRKLNAHKGIIPRNPNHSDNWRTSKMRDRVTISLNPRLTTRLTRLSKRKPCSSCACSLIPHRALSGKKSRIIFANVNILFTSGRVRNRFTTGSRDSIRCERDPEFGDLFTFLYLLLYLYLSSFFTKYRNNLNKNGFNCSKNGALFTFL